MDVLGKLFFLQFPMWHDFTAGDCGRNSVQLSIPNERLYWMHYMQDGSYFKLNIPNCVSMQKSLSTIHKKIDMSLFV